MFSPDKKQLAVLKIFLNQTEIELSRFLKYFNDDLADKFPDKSQRLKANSSIEPTCSMRTSMQSRFNFIKTSLILFFGNSSEKAGINKKLIENVSEILNHS